MSDLNKQTHPGSTDPRTRIRRTDRAIVDEARIIDLLHQAQVGFIATSYEDQPYLNANLFWFDEEQRRIYFHTAHQGRTRSNIETNPQVSFSIAKLGELIPADVALEFSAEYTGVVVFGQARIVDEPDEAEHGLYGLLKKYFPEHQPGRDYRAITADELARTSVFAIDIETWSGKQKERAT